MGKFNAASGRENHFKRIRAEDPSSGDGDDGAPTMTAAKGGISGSVPHFTCGQFIEFELEAALDGVTNFGDFNCELFSEHDVNPRSESGNQKDLMKSLAAAVRRGDRIQPESAVQERQIGHMQGQYPMSTLLNESAAPNRGCTGFAHDFDGLDT